MNRSSRSFKILNKVLITSNSNTQELPDDTELSLAIENLQKECFEAQSVLNNENIDPNLGNSNFVSELVGLNTSDVLNTLDIDCLDNITLIEEKERRIDENISIGENVALNNELDNSSDIIEQEPQNDSNLDNERSESEYNLDENYESTSDKSDENDEDDNSEEEESFRQPNKKRKRKKNRLSKSEDWEYNSNKQKREKGDMYLGRKDNRFTVKKCKRGIKNRCLCSKEKNNAFECYKIKEEQRQHIFAEFWNFSWKEKQVYVLGRTTVTETKRVRNRKDDSVSRRTTSCNYFLNKKKKEERVRVCKTMFCNTLGMSSRTISLWIQKGSNTPEKFPSNQTDPNVNKQNEENPEAEQPKELKSLEKKTSIRDFFQCLPKLESHYCRKSTSKLYLEPRWRNKSELYSVYKDSWCKENKIEPASLTLFKYVFEEMNLSLFSPKKDQCDVCVGYETKNISEEIYQQHVLKKEEARNEKQKDKESADKVFTMDLQSVLLCPKSNVSALYYKTKLIVHNFTIFDLHTKDGYCFIWHEGEGELKANCFASIICNFLSTKILPTIDTAPDNKPNIILYSDGCGAQNRNSILANALFNFSLQNNICIIQKYLEKGHTQMECDSMHSSIERKISGRVINVPADYVYYAKTARKTPKPYEVQYIQHSYFKDFSKLNYVGSIRPGRKIGDPTVQNIRALKYKPEGSIEFKLGHSEHEQFKPLPIRLSKNIKFTKMENLPSLYKNKLKIKRDKFDNLQSLKNTMEQDYYGFYDSLEHD